MDADFFNRGAGWRFFQDPAGPHRLAKEHVDTFGPTIAMGTLRGVAEALHLDSSGGRTRLERLINDFNAVEFAARMDVDPKELQDVISWLEFLREYGSALAALIAGARRAAGHRN